MWGQTHKKKTRPDTREAGGKDVTKWKEIKSGGDVKTCTWFDTHKLFVTLVGVLSHKWWGGYDKWTAILGNAFMNLAIQERDQRENLTSSNATGKIQWRERDWRHRTEK